MGSQLRAAVILTAIAFVIAAFNVAAQNVSASAPPSAGGFRIAGTVVSKIDAHPIAGAQVAIASTQARQQPLSVATS